MRNVLIVVNDETLINRMKIAYNRNDYEYFYVTEGSAAMAAADLNEIAVAVIDFKLPILSGIEVCETLASSNLKTQFIFLFEGNDIEAVLKFYNRYHITKLVCKEEFDLETLHEYIDDCMHIYYQQDELLKMKENVEAVSEKYLKPMTDMSNLLNERLKCFDYISKVFMCCINQHIKSGVSDVRSLNVFMGRIVNDYIQLFMIQEPDSASFLNNLNIFYNKPDNKKYFKFVGNNVSIEDNKLNILFALNLITMCFDTFFSMYRGKIELSQSDDRIDINSVYEVRYLQGDDGSADKALKICRAVLENYCDSLKFARKDELVQFKAGFLRVQSKS